MSVHPTFDGEFRKAGALTSHLPNQDEIGRRANGKVAAHATAPIVASLELDAVAHDAKRA
jgi:hypothetical protein